MRSRCKMYRFVCLELVCDSIWEYLRCSLYYTECCAMALKISFSSSFREVVKPVRRKSIMYFMRLMSFSVLVSRFVWAAIWFCMAAISLLIFSWNSFTDDFSEFTWVFNVSDKFEIWHYDWLLKTAIWLLSLARTAQAQRGRDKCMCWVTHLGNI